MKEIMQSSNKFPCLRKGKVERTKIHLQKCYLSHKTKRKIQFEYFFPVHLKQIDFYLGNVFLNFHFDERHGIMILKLKNIRMNAKIQKYEYKEI